MNWTPITRKLVNIKVSALTRTGSAATIAGISVALTNFRQAPNEATVWTAASYAAGIATCTLAGYDADPTGALVVPIGGADLWIKLVDNTEVDAVRVVRISMS